MYLCNEGMWADDENGSEGRDKRSFKERKSYTTPVAFVSGGVKIGDKVTKENLEEDDDDVTVRQ